MNKVVFIYGASGVGKSTLAKRIAKERTYAHADYDRYKRTFRNKEEAQLRCYKYALARVNKRENVIVEALRKDYINQIQKLAKKNKYKIIEISLHASLDTCLERNRKRTHKLSERIIRKAHQKYSVKKGTIINVTNMNKEDVFQKVKKII